MKHFAALLLFICAVAPARAVTEIFLKLSDIPGESRDSIHREEIDVLSYSWGSSHVAGKLNMRDLSVTKFVDKSSPALLLAVALSRPIRNAVLIVRQPGPSGYEFLMYRLTNVIVTSVSSTIDQGMDRPTQNISMAFHMLEYAYRQQDYTGKVFPPVCTCFDITAMKPCPCAGYPASFLTKPLK